MRSPAEQPQPAASPADDYTARIAAAEQLVAETCAEHGVTGGAGRRIATAAVQAVMSALPGVAGEPRPDDPAAPRGEIIFDPLAAGTGIVDVDRAVWLSDLTLGLVHVAEPGRIDTRKAYALQFAGQVNITGAPHRAVYLTGLAGLATLLVETNLIAVRAGDDAELERIVQGTVATLGANLPAGRT